jgi:Nif-specific regulatory protein
VVDSSGLRIGRDPSNTVCIRNGTVSLRHCRIDCDDQRFLLVDEESTNGTFVNGECIQKKYLEHGDEIRVAGTTFYFMVGEMGLPLPRRVRVEDQDEGELLSSRTVELNPLNSAYLGTSIPVDDGQIGRLTHDTSVLLKLAVEINQIDNSETLQNRLLERIFELVPAESGAILLSSSDSGDFQPDPVCRQRMAQREFRVSRSVTRQVRVTGTSVLRNDLLADVTSSESIQSSGVRSVLCVPLIVMGERRGVLYLDTGNPNMPFDERHLELVTAIASIASVALEHLGYMDWLEAQNRQLMHEVTVQHDMVGQSPKMLKLYGAIADIAPTESRVLILGESGTGKELAARAIHKNSGRRNGPFIVVNCAAIQDTLFRSELFGHVRGAFTGADRDHKGYIEEADGGTLFLDELGEIPLHCQAALLRVIEDQHVERVGSYRAIPVNVRFISATNQPLSKLVDDGGFRADLYFRLGLPLEVPPLRDRVEDIPPLVTFFLQKHRNYTQREIGATPPRTIQALQQYHWPGNVRELIRAIQWALVFGKSDRIRCEDLPVEITQQSVGSVPVPYSLDQAMESLERQFILRALQETNGNVVEASALICRAPNYLQRRISQLNLRDELERIRRSK